MEPSTYTLQGWHRFERGALVVGLGALALCLVGAVFSAPQFYRSYLFAYVFWIGIAVGCLGIMMLHNLTGGAWGIVIRRLVESGTRTLPLMFLLFLPLLFGLETLYEWARPEAVAQDYLLEEKSAYLNVPFFLIRTLLYFAFWIGAGTLLTNWSRENDRTADPRLIQRQRVLSGPGLVLLALTITFASIDWVMSLEPHWFSTIYGVHFMGGYALSAFAFTILLSGMLAREEPLVNVVLPSHFHDLGNLLLAFVMLWAYFAFSQWLIIWSGNLPDEVTWYVRRIQGGWQWVGLVLFLFHFLAPFVLLLSRTMKRRVETLCAIAAALFIMRLLDVFWYTVPAFHPSAIAIHWMDIAAPVGIGGLWLAFFMWQLRPVALLPLGDPAVKESLDRGRH